MKNYNNSSLAQFLCRLVLRFIGWLLISYLASVTVAITMVILHGFSGLTGLKAVMQNDYQTVVAIVKPCTLSLVNQLLNAIPGVTNLSNYSLPMFSHQYQYDFWMHILSALSVIFLASKLVIIRLILLLQWLPLFLLLGLVGLIDGLTQRAIRRASVGRESAVIYHGTKPLIIMSLLLGVFLTIALPISLSLLSITITVAAVVFGLAIQVTSKSFKKYL